MITQALTSVTTEQLNTILRANFPRRFSTSTKTMVATLKDMGYKVTEDKLNKMLGRFSKDYTPRVNNLTPHKAALLSAVREVVPFPYDNQFLLNHIGEAYSIKSAIARVEAGIHVR